MATVPTRPWGPSLVVLAAVTGVAVSTIYLPQPLLTDFISQLGASTGAASSIATAVQLGTRSVAAGFFVVGLVANIAQLIIPTAVRLAPHEAKHSTTSALVGSLLIGIFGGRVVAGLLGTLVGWRGVLLLFALLVLVCLPLLRRVVPARMDVADRTAYHRILLSTVRRLATNRVLLESAIMQLLGFAAFNAVWTVMVLHLTGPALRWSPAAAGLFGLVGLAAGVVTLASARAVQRLGSARTVTLSIVVLLVALLSVVVDNRLIWLFVPSMFLLTWANQLLQSANQGRVLLANQGGAAQANTMFMTAVFLGGSLGAALGPVAFQSDGMTGVAELGLVLVALSGVTWLLASLVRRRAARRSPTGTSVTAGA